MLDIKYLCTKRDVMLKDSDAFPVIHSIIPHAYNIKRPTLQGSLQSVFIAKSIDGHFVCKFNHKDLAQKNEIISKTMLSNGINVPAIKIYDDGGFFIEVYRFIPGKTLYEHIGNGLSSEKIQYVYHDIVDAFIKMGSLPTKALDGLKCSRTDQVAKANITDTNNRIIAAICSKAIKTVNNADQAHKGLYHCGITPKNVILNDAGQFKAILDLDEAAIADKNYAFGMMVAKYQQLGQNINDLIDYYELKSGKKLNHKKVQRIANITNAGKSILWHISHLTKTK